MIELPVMAERWAMEGILTSLIEAISDYYLWLTNSITDDTDLDEDEVEEVLQAYLQCCENT